MSGQCCGGPFHNSFWGCHLGMPDTSLGLRSTENTRELEACNLLCRKMSTFMGSPLICPTKKRKDKKIEGGLSYTPKQKHIPKRSIPQAQSSDSFNSAQQQISCQVCCSIVITLLITNPHNIQATKLLFVCF